MRMKLKETNNIGGEHIIDRTLSIFNSILTLGESSPFTWLDQQFADDLDVEYYLNHSGDKSLSPMFDKLWNIEETKSNVVKKLASIIVGKFKDKWDKLHEAFINSDYEPLNNYSMEELETPNITRSTIEKTSTKVKTATTNDKTESGVYGFNSSNPVPNVENVRNAEVEVSGTGEDNKNDKTETETGTRSLTRSGNIGVTTSQQMLQSEIDLRTNFNFINMLFKDVDSVMTLPIYEL